MPLREDLLNPIPGDNPSGVNLRYDPVTDKIKEARREDLDVPQGDWKTTLKTADYPLVIKLASDALVKRGKDLQIAVWLVDAIIRREGFSQLGPCFRFLRELLEQFWDTLYPEIEDDDREVRAAPLDGLGAKLGEPLKTLPITSDKLSWASYQESRIVGYEADADTYEKQQARTARIEEGKITADQFDESADATPMSVLKGTLNALNEGLAESEFLAELCDTQFGAAAPSFITTRNVIEEITQTVRILINRRPAEAEPEPEETLTEDASAELAFEAAEGAEIQNEPNLEQSPAARPAARAGRPAAAPTSVEEVPRQLASICNFLRQNDPRDPAPYLIMRSYAWAKFMLNAPNMYPETLEAPPSDLRVSLKRHAANSEWDKVLETTEAAMALPCAGPWLDLHRYAIQALEQNNFIATALVVRHQLKTLLEDLPGLPKATLLDDTPAANDETRLWIDEYVVQQGYQLRNPEASGESPSESTSFDETPTDTSLDTDTSTSFDTDTSSSSLDTDISSLDTSFSLESTPEPEATPEAEPVAELDLAPLNLDEIPPILEPEAPPPSDTSDEFQLALEAVRDGRTAEGLKMITAILATERSGRARFRRRTQLAHLLMAAGKDKIAHPLLSQLATEIEERRLEDWEENEAVAYPLELLLRCLDGADEQRQQLYMKLCRLDPVRAVNCSA